jgi:hypothetical protein
MKHPSSNYFDCECGNQYKFENIHEIRTCLDSLIAHQCPKCRRPAILVTDVLSAKTSDYTSYKRMPVRPGEDPDLYNIKNFSI